jgi:hypothetical protein
LLIDSILPDVIDPINRKFHLSGDDGSLLDISSDSLKFDLSSTIGIRMLISNLGFQIISTNDSQCVLNNEQFCISTSDNSVLATSSKLSLKSNESILNINSNGIQTDSLLNLSSQNIKITGGIVHDVYYISNGEYILPTMNYILAENCNELFMYINSYYLVENEVGFSFYISNLNGIDLLIHNDNSYWFSHAQQLTSGDIIIKKWSTVKITLVRSVDWGLIWAISQF